MYRHTLSLICVKQTRNIADFEYAYIYGCPQIVALLEYAKNYDMKLIRLLMIMTIT